MKYLLLRKIKHIEHIVISIDIYQRLTDILKNWGFKNRTKFLYKDLKNKQKIVESLDSRSALQFDKNFLESKKIIQKTSYKIQIKEEKTIYRCYRS